MQITDEHEQRAAKLVAEVWWDREDIEPSPAFRGYLAAVERIREGELSGELARGGDELGGVASAVIDGEVPGTIDVSVCDPLISGVEWTPAEARAFAYELLVLADLAEAATPEGTDG